jgi:hypothetical protein
MIPNLPLNGNGNVALGERSSGGATRHRIQEDPHNKDDFETPSTVLHPQVLEPRKSLKQLRRGPTSELMLAAGKVEPKGKCLDGDDEIEEFSEEEQPLGKSIFIFLCWFLLFFCFFPSMISFHSKFFFLFSLGEKTNARDKFAFNLIRIFLIIYYIY